MSHYEKRSRDRLRFGGEFLKVVQQHAEVRVGGISPRREALSECMKQLSQKQREMLLCYYSDEGSRQRLAGKVGKTYAALRQTICRVRAVLAECIERRLNNASGIR